MAKRKKMKWTRRLLGGIGDVAKWAAPIAGVIPGVGTAIGAGLGAVGGALGTVNDRNEDGSIRDLSWKRALKHGAGRALYGGLGAAGVAKVAGGTLAGGGGLKGLAGVKGLGGWGGVKSALVGKPGTAYAKGSKGLLGGAADWIRKNPKDAALLGLAGASMYSNARDSAKNDARERELMAMVNEDSDIKKALRQKARGTLLTGLPVQEDLSGVFHDPGNVYSRRA